MPIEKNEARLTKTGSIVTPRGRLSFFGAPALFRPVLAKGETDKDKAKFQAMLLFPKDADISLLRTTVKERIMATNWTKAEKDKVISTDAMFHDTRDDPYLNELHEQFPFSIRTGTRVAPDVRTASLETCLDETQVYAGRWARLVVNPWCYSYGGKGVTWDLQLVQLLKNDEPFTSFSRPRAEDAFEKAELEADGDSLEGVL
jgi:Protein of unknown function (DUF2815)